MKDDLEQLLTNLGLKRVKEILDGEIEKARKGQLIDTTDPAAAAAELVTALREAGSLERNGQ